MNTYEIVDAIRESARLVADTYLEHHIFVDFALFTVFFISLGWATLKDRFPGPAGKALSVTLGLALSISLTLAMAHWGISLRDAAIVPIALLALLMFLLSLSLHNKQHLGMPTAMAVALLVFTVFLTPILTTDRKIIPIDPNFAIVALGILLILRFLYGMCRGGSWQNGPSRGRKVDAARRKTSDYTKGISLHVRWALQRGWELMQRMKRLVVAWRAPNGEKPPRQVLEKALLDLSVLEAELDERLRSISKTTALLEKTEAKAYRDLAGRAARSNGPVRQNASRQLALERAKVGQEDSIRQVAHKAQHHVRRIRHCLAKAKHHLQNANESRAEEWLETALERQQGLLELLAKLAEWEHRLEQMSELQAENKPGHE